MPTDDATPRFAADALTDFAAEVFEHTGFPEVRARRVAETLVEADLMGHATHGLRLLPFYAKAAARGTMTATGTPEVVQDRGAAVTWDGRYLPGPWLIHRALDLALDRVATHPAVTVVIRRSHHTACLATYLERATDEGLVMLLACSDPKDEVVVPHGGLRGAYSTAPMAAGLPARTEPVLFDISTSSVSYGTVHLRAREGGRLAHPWLLTSEGEPTDDPVAVYDDPPASLLPLGGLEGGHKGFALGLLVEALTGGLSGYGRADDPERWSVNVFLQLLAPGAFGGREAFLDQTEALAEACRSTPARPGHAPVRLPGHRARRLREEQRAHGVHLAPSILDALRDCAERYGVALPEPFARI